MWGAAPLAAAQDKLLIGLGGVELFLPGAAECGMMEFRSGHSIGRFRPIAGFLIDGRSDKYFYAGLAYPWLRGERWRLWISFSVGGLRQGEGRIIGGPLEFNTTVRLEHRIGKTLRGGLAFSHISNAGIYKKNPGMEVSTVFLTLPLGGSGFAKSD